MNPPPILVRAPEPRAVRALTLPVLGIPVCIQSNSAEVMAVAEEAFGAWRGAVAEGEWMDRPPVRVRVRVVPGREGGRRGPILPRVAGAERMVIRTRGSRVVADVGRRAAAARVSAELAADREQFRHGVLEAMVLWLLTGLDRQPLHAAAVVRGKTALLLAGRSGVGKSTLVYAAMRAGLKVLAEDCVFLQQHPDLRVWGMPGFVHLMPEAAHWFPELASTAPMLRANGKTKLAIDVRAAGAAAPPRAVSRAGVCLLARGGEPGLAPLTPREVAAALTAAPEPGFDRFAGTIGGPLRRVAARGGWRMTLPPSPMDAVPLLHRMFDALEG